MFVYYNSLVYRCIHSKSVSDNFNIPLKCKIAILKLFPVHQWLKASMYKVMLISTVIILQVMNVYFDPANFVH